MSGPVQDLRAEELRRRMPEPLVRGEFAAEGTLESIAARFAVSVEAMAWRLCNLGLAEVRPVQH